MKKLKNEIIIWFILVSIIPLMVLSVLSTLDQKSKYEESTKKYLTEVLNNKVAATENYIYNIQSLTELMAMDPTIADVFNEYNNRFISKEVFTEGYKSVQNKVFNKIVEKNEFSDLMLINLNGDLIYSVKEEKDLYQNVKTGLLKNSGLAWAFDKTSTLIDTEISDFQYYTPSNEQAAFISTPIFQDKKLIGVLAVQISEKELFDKVVDYTGLGETGEITAGYFDEDGNVISSIPLRYYPDAFKNRMILQPKNALNDIPTTRALKRNHGCEVTLDYRGKRTFAAWKYVPSLRWGMVAKIDYDEVMTPVYKQIWIDISVMALVIMTIIFIVFIVTKHIVDPILLLTSQVKGFSDGIVDENMQEIEERNEIGALAKAFYKMSKSLRVSQEKVKKYANQLEAKVKARTQELADAKMNLEILNNKMKKYIDILDEYVISSSTDLEGTITDVSDAFCKTSGYSREELIGKKHGILRHPDMSDKLYKSLWATITNGKTWKGDIKNQRKDGTSYWVSVAITPIYDDNGIKTGYTSIRQDITDKKQVEVLSITDQLTQIFNRMYLENKLTQEINRSKRYKKSFSIIIIDIDHFKKINDTYGHDIGDMVLIRFANILKTNIRSIDVVGRWGGEEFLIICPETTAEGALNIAEKIRKLVENTVFKSNDKVTCSLGVSEFNLKETGSKEIIKRADNALYAAKHKGRNCTVVG